MNSLSPDTWPLWDLTPIEYGGAPWFHLQGLPPLAGKPDGLRRVLQEFKRLNHVCLVEGVKGWLMGVEFTNLRVHRWLMSIGAMPYTTHGKWVYFLKRAGSGLPASVSAAARAISLKRGVHA